MDFGQGPAVAGQGELPPEGKYREYWEKILPCESGEALEQVALTLQGMEQVCFHSSHSRGLVYYFYYLAQHKGSVHL